MARECWNCQFGEKGFTEIVCRRLPPLVVRIMGNPPETYWPSVKPNDWCGEFKPRGDTAPADPGRRGPSFSHGRRTVVDEAPRGRRVVEKA